MGIARAGQGGEHDGGAQKGVTERGKAERRAWQKGKTEWRVRVRARNNMSGQDNEWQGKARNGTKGAGAEALLRRAC